MQAELILDEELLRRMPLPLAQLARRSSNAKGPLDRHLAAYYLWEAALKLLGSASIVAYAERGEHDPKLAERLQNLARPALGHWWEFTRSLTPVLAAAGDAGFGSVRDVLLGPARSDLPRVTQLDAALREALEGSAATRSSVRLSELFDRLVRYRNRELGHGAAGQRPPDHYDRMGRALLAGVCELLGRLDVLAGSRLVYVSEVRRQRSRLWLVERIELVGESARRIESLEVPEPDPARLPRPDELYLEAPDGTSRRALRPLVLFDPEAGEVLFLNSRRERQRAEYLCYTTGRLLDVKDLGAEQRELLARVLGMPVDSSATEAWAARSQAEEPPREGEAEEKPGSPGRTLGEFELQSELGRGGMGVVYRAWQPSLGRQVALKCLMHAGDAKALARFTREIHALGRVDHPNLVKIFTSGTDSDHWFYAMELVEGSSLAALCDALARQGANASELDVGTWQDTLSTTWEESKKAEKAVVSGGPASEFGATLSPRRAGPERAQAARSAQAPGAGRGYVRKMVELVRQVAEATHALHNAGVIHRDIKPGNIVVTADGEQAVLMDLGLAQLADETDGRLTRTSQFVGTLRYASPEQVLGVAKLSPQSDVYSLGATLWELLTMRPLFGATDQMPTPELLERIQYHEPERLRKLNPAVASDLEAIVLKCLEKDPARRYSTAALLADDLARFQAGELVTAQPLTLRYAAGKFIRRHRMPIALAAAILFATIAGTAWSFYQIQMALRDARSQRNEAQRQRKAAEANFLLARKAVDEYFTRVSENRLLDVPGMEPLRQDLLEAAQSFYEEFLKQHAADPHLQAELANAYSRVGWIKAQSRGAGAEKAALEAYRKALALFANLARMSNDRGRVHDLGHGQTDLGNLLHELGRTDEAGELFQAALKVREDLAGRFPAEAEYQADLASIHNNLGNLLRDTGRSSQALAHYKTALDIRRKQIERDARSPDFQEELARSLMNLSKLEGELGRSETALRDEREAEGILEALAGKHPDVVRYRVELASSLEALGVSLGQTADPEGAAKSYRKAEAIREKLVREHPTVSRYERDLARSRYHLAALAGQPGRPTDDEPALLNTLEAFERLARDHPDVFRYQIDVANAHNALGDLHAASGQTVKEEHSYGTALAVLDSLSHAHPKLTRPAADLGLTHLQLGDLNAATGRPSQAEDEYRDAIGIFERLAAQEPEVLAHRSDLAKGWFSLGKAFDQAGEPSLAKKDAFEKALAIRTKLASDDP
ncbi:MAG TPA: serine/threonine-protein kinase, partial [Isosphaeraceae bacterium]|nr:serine/threonine-protein kinase [Isosphaeraceae bacterium]